MKLVYLTFIILAVAASNQLSAQGCVAIRSTGNSCSLGRPESAKGWLMNMNNRYFKSYKHFVGTIEQKEREENGTEVINHNYSIDLTATRFFNSRWWVSITVPVISNTRSSLYEHGGNSGGEGARHSTQSFGIGDIRISAYRWLLDPATHYKGNIQAGLGVKLPTGDYQYMDYFYKSDGTTVLGPVDQSIQLGDGGTGIIGELNGFYNFSHRLGVYANFFYMANPREQNGVSTARGGTPSASNVQYFSSVMSVPDQYMTRGGVSYMFDRFTTSAGIRIEGIPSSDLIGGDKGFRRPGIVVAAEPTISFRAKKLELYLSVPVALQRNRTQSYSDKLRSEATGTKVQGDAAFADYVINAGLSFRL
jgi:hypothetical protein